MLNAVDGDTELVMWKLPKLHKAAIKDPENALPSISLPITPQISKLAIYGQAIEIPHQLTWKDSTVRKQHGIHRLCLLSS